MAARKHAIFLTVIAVIAVIAAAIVMWLFAAFYGAFAIEAERTEACALFTQWKKELDKAGIL